MFLRYSPARARDLASGFVVFLIIAAIFTVSRPAVAAAPLQIGVFLPTGDPAVLTQWESAVGRRQDIVMFFQAWADANGPLAFDTARAQAIVDRGSVPMVTWEPWQWGADPVKQPAYALRQISSGKHDGYIRTYARAVKRVGGTVYIRFMHEMNGNWYPWAGTVNGNTPADFAPAFRHVVDIFRQEGALNAKWVWCPNNAGLPDWGVTSFGTYWPGEAYVDFAAVDGYNFGTTVAGLSWADFDTVFKKAYERIGAITKKPIIIAETAAAEAGGSKSAWITGAFRRLSTAYPRITALIWFNEKKETDWRVESSPTSLSAYRTAMATQLARQTSDPRGRLIRLDDGAAKYSSGWEALSVGKAYKGTVHSTRSGKARLTLRFKGRQIKLLGTKGPRFGRATVTVDGVKVGEIDARASTRKFRQKLFVWPAKPKRRTRTHTLHVKFTPGKYLSAGHRRIDIDAFAARR